MQALQGIVSPINQSTSLQLFYDSMESHVRGRESLGRAHESYGDLLAPIILGKLPHELRKNLARKPDSPEWKFQELREAIVKKIRILEEDAQLNGTLYGFALTITSSFLTQIQGNHLHPGKSNKSEPKGKCTYCKGPHSSYNCNVITDCQQRWSMIKRERLCFNCLGNPKPSTCTPRYRCHKCKGKHLTSLCSREHSPRGTATAPPAPTVPTNTPQDTSEPSTSSVHATLAPITDPTPAASFPISGGQISLLKTAISIVNTEHIYCEANVLLDEGTQRSFITYAPSNQLGVPLLKSESISLSAFGA